jgi:hypothetical protein
MDGEGAGELSCTNITVLPLAGTLLGETLSGFGTSEQFNRTLFEYENPSLDTAIETSPEVRTGEIHTATVLEMITADTYIDSDVAL